MMYFRAMNWTELQAFDSNTKEQWLKAIQKELGDKSLESLQWSPSAGISLDPYYTTIERVEWQNSGVMPFLIHQSVGGNGNQNAHDEAMQCLTGGAQSIGFDEVPANMDWHSQLQDIEWPFIQIFWKNFPFTSSAVESLAAYASQRGWDKSALRGSFGVDAAVLWKNKIDQETIAAFRTHFPACRIFVIREHTVLGGQSGHAIAGVLAQVQEALHSLVSNGWTIDDASAMIQINAEVGTSYFREITKLRVLRHLYGEVVKAYAPKHACSTSIWMHTTTSSETYAEVDTDTNLLRATTMAMSAAIGQSSSIEIAPHDASYDRINTLRWSRNMLHLLREESYFDHALHAAKGSYYLESFAQQMAKDAWERLHSIEEAGGWISQEEAWLNTSDRFANEHKERIAKGEIIQVGVNKYQPKAHAKS